MIHYKSNCDFNWYVAFEGIKERIRILHTVLVYLIGYIFVDKNASILRTFITGTP
jgi:hypothetical protein